MGLDLEALKKKQLNLKRGKNNGNTWRPEKGEQGNCIRVFKFTHKITKEDVTLGLFPKDKIGKTIEEFDRPFTRHFGMTENNAPVFSTKELMTKYNQLAKSKDKSDQKLAKVIRPDTRFVLNIVDTNKPEDGMKLWLSPKTFRTELGDYLIDDEYGESILGVSGRDFKVVFDPDADPKNMYKIKLRDAGKSRKLSSKFNEAIIDLYSPEVYASFALEYEGDGEIAVPETPEKETKKEDDENEVEKPKKKEKDDDDDGDDSLFDD